MKILFIGGTGIISTACSQLAVEQGHDLYVLNRGLTGRPLPAGVHRLQGDIRDPVQTADLLGKMQFDAAADWVAYLPEHVEADIRLFRKRVGQYVFISSASAYQKPPARLPVTEATPLVNPYWEYSRAKIACEERLLRANREEAFPVTIVRPSHTYDRTYIPLQGGYTAVERMRRGQKVIVPGDGTSLWVLTHNTDFAKGFVGLLGKAAAIGEAFQITSDELLTWNQIYEAIARAAGAVPKLVHVPSDLIAAYDPEWGANLLGDKAYSMIFDNAKIKLAVPGFAATVPFSQGAAEIMAWYDADPSRRTLDERQTQTFDRILRAYERAWPNP